MLLPFKLNALKTPMPCVENVVRMRERLDGGCAASFILSMRHAISGRLLRYLYRIYTYYNT